MGKEGKDGLPTEAEFARFIKELSMSSRSVDYIRTVEDRLLKWNRFLIGRGRKLLEAVPEDFAAYIGFINASGCAVGYAKVLIIAVRQFYKWLEREGVIIKSPIHNDRIRYRPIYERKSYVYPEELFGIRRLIKSLKIEQALWIELAVSTGMRPSEQHQIRACDVKFGVVPHDAILGIPSPYIGARIDIDTNLMVNKTDTSRTVWAGVLATDLIRRHMRKFGIKPDSVVPLFPWSQLTCEKWVIEDLNPLLKEHPFFQKFNTVNTAESRNKDLSDVDLSGSSVSEKFRKLISKRQSSSSEEANAMGETPGVVGERNINTRAFRRTFSCMMWYRNVHGERHNRDRLRELMGHANDSSVTLRYMMSLDLIKNDEEWARILTGRPSDWVFCK
jgi:integrase